MRLIMDLPIEKKHGCVAGAEFEIIGWEEKRGRKTSFIGKAGEECCAFSNEYELVKQPKEDGNTCGYLTSA